MSAPAIPPEVFAQVTQAWAIQDYAQGERLLAEARKTYPDHWHLRTCHAAAIAYCSRFRSARAAFDSLIADAPAEKKVHMHGLLGVEWCRIGRHDLAIPLLRVAVAAPHPPAPVYEALASALEHVRQHTEAQETLNHGLLQFPGHPGLLIVQASLHRQARQFDLAEQAARQILINPQASPEAKTRAGHELGQALDAQCRFAEAFLAFSTAKKSRKAQLAPFLPIWQNGLDRLKEHSMPSRQQLASWQSSSRTLIEAEGAHRLAMLVGCPRSGTTLLERTLDAHPQLVSASETTIFSNVWNTLLHDIRPVAGLAQVFARLSLADTRRLRDSYWSQIEEALEQPVGDRLLLDKNPSQLPQVPAIVCLHPEARILMALRDPRAIAWSSFSQYLPDNSESAAFNSLETTAIHVQSQLRFWLMLRERLPAGTWHEARYESLVGDFEAESRRTLEFLGLPWDPAVADFHANPSPVRSPTYAEAARPVYQNAVDKWRHYEEFLGDAFKPLDSLARDLA